MAGAVLTGAEARRERNRREMREIIQDAALEIISEQGMSALTMRGLAQAIGYSPAALYEYFPAKEDLYASLFITGRDGFTERIRTHLAALSPNASANERLHVLGHAYRAYAHEQPDLFRMALGDPRPSPTPGFQPQSIQQTAGTRRTAIDLLLAIVAEGIDRDEFAPAPAMTIAIAAWSTIHGFVMLELNGHLAPEEPSDATGQTVTDESAESPDDLFAATLRLILAGFERRSPATPE